MLLTLAGDIHVVLRHGVGRVKYRESTSRQLWLEGLVWRSLVTSQLPDTAFAVVVLSIVGAAPSKRKKNLSYLQESNP